MTEWKWYWKEKDDDWREYTIGVRQFIVNIIILFLKELLNYTIWGFTKIISSNNGHAVETFSALVGMHWAQLYEIYHCFFTQMFRH